MKRILTIVGLLFSIVLAGCWQRVSAVTLSQALDSNKAYVLLVYTEWTDYKTIYSNLKKLQPKYPNCNFVKVSLEEKEAAALFDGRVVIRTLPMVLIGKRNGSLNIDVPIDCASDYECISKKLKKYVR